MKNSSEPDPNYLLSATSLLFAQLFLFSFGSLDKHLCICAVLPMVCQTMCESPHAGDSPTQLDMAALAAAYNSHRILFLTSLGTLAVLLLGCLGCLCYTCCRLAQRSVESLDAYAPRTQSIVWPAIPVETAQVLEMTFLHAPDSVDCLCHGCIVSRKQKEATEC